MIKQKLTKLTILTLSCLVLGSCKTTPTIEDFPDDPFYTTDLVNQVCAEYKLVDKTNITFIWVEDLPLVPGGPCDHMRGWSSQGWKHVQNWTRDTIQADEGN